MSLCPTLCEVTRVFTNKGKPPAHKPVSAAALEETVRTEERRRGVSCPGFLCSWEGGPDSFPGSNASFGFLETVLARVTSVTGESWCPVQPDLKDRNVVVAVVLGQQGDLRPLPERFLWVADFKVSGVKLEQSEHFYLYFQGVSEYKHINLWGGDERKVMGAHSQMPASPLRRRESVLKLVRWWARGQTHMWTVCGCGIGDRHGRRLHGRQGTNRERSL